jgi:DNA-binding MarR family transcriptional regulator
VLQWLTPDMLTLRYPGGAAAAGTTDRGAARAHQVVKTLDHIVKQVDEPVKGAAAVAERLEEFPTILALLHAPAQAIIRQVQADLAAAGYNDLSPVHFNVLPYLRPGGSRLTRLAEAAQASKQLMNHLVDHLERRGYVERIPDPVDGRAKLIRLTGRGRQLSLATQKSLRKVQARAARRLGQSELVQLRNLLLGLAAALRS